MLLISISSFISQTRLYFCCWAYSHFHQFVWKTVSKFLKLFPIYWTCNNDRKRILFLTQNTQRDHWILVNYWKEVIRLCDCVSRFDTRKAHFISSLSNRMRLKYGSFHLYFIWFIFLYPFPPHPFQTIHIVKTSIPSVHIHHA